MDDWQKPVPLRESSFAPEFPVECLPGWMADWCRDAAEEVQVPVDLPIMLCLTFAGAGLGRTVQVQIRPGWVESLNLYTVSVLAVGERKSVVLRHAKRPIVEREQERINDAALRIAPQQSEHRILEGRVKALEARAAKEDNAVERGNLKQQAKEAAQQLAAHHVEPKPQLLVDDVTPEKLAELIAEQGGRMLQASPEGTLFEIVKGRYSDKPNFDVYLKAHSGDDLTEDRISRGHCQLQRPALSIGITVQPDVIMDLNDQTSMRGRGFVARFGYSVPRSVVGVRQIGGKPMRAEVAANYTARMKQLWQIGAGEETTLNFSKEADRVMRAFECWLEPQLAPESHLASLAGWANKLAGRCARIAGILHVGRCVGEGKAWNGDIPVATVRDAIVIGRDYFLPHAHAAFARMGQTERLEDARRVARWLLRNGCAEISRRDIHAQVLGSRYNSDQVDAVIAILVNLGYLALIEDRHRKGRARSPGPRYEVNKRIEEVTL